MEELVLNEAGRTLVARHRRWWSGEAMLIAFDHSPPLGDLWVPLVDGTDASADMALTPEHLDADRLAGPQLTPGPLEIDGDFFRVACPYSRIPWVEAIVGCRIEALIKAGSMRAVPFVKGWRDWRGAEAHHSEAWRRLLLSLTDDLVARTAGRQAVTTTLMRGPSDLAEAVLGPELTCFSIFDHPAELRMFLSEVTDTFIRLQSDQLARCRPVAGGYVSLFGIWAPGTVVRTQTDASAFLSPKHYAEWFLPEDVRICESVDTSIIHLHSCSMHTVDDLLPLERPHAIQVTLETEPSGPPLVDLVPIFRRILDAKPLLIQGYLSKAQLAMLLDQLPHGGLAITARDTPW